MRRAPRNRKSSARGLRSLIRSWLQAARSMPAGAERELAKHVMVSAIAPRDPDQLTLLNSGTAAWRASRSLGIKRSCRNGTVGGRTRRKSESIRI